MLLLLLLDAPNNESDASLGDEPNSEAVADAAADDLATADGAD